MNISCTDIWNDSKLEINKRRRPAEDDAFLPSRWAKPLFSQKCTRKLLIPFLKLTTLMR